LKGDKTQQSSSRKLRTVFFDSIQSSFRSHWFICSNSGLNKHSFDINLVLRIFAERKNAEQKNAERKNAENWIPKNAERKNAEWRNVEM
jgi:hypothetical protein